MSSKLNKSSLLILFMTTTLVASCAGSGARLNTAPTDPQVLQQCNQLYKDMQHHADEAETIFINHRERNKEPVTLEDALKSSLLVVAAIPGFIVMSPGILVMAYTGYDIQKGLAERRAEKFAKLSEEEKEKQIQVWEQRGSEHRKDLIDDPTYTPEFPEEEKTILHQHEKHYSELRATAIETGCNYDSLPEWKY